MQKRNQNRPGKFTSGLVALLVTLLLMTAPLRTVSAQGQQASGSASAEITRLKTAYSEALDRIESDKVRLEASDAYIKRLEEEKGISDKALSVAKDEREALYRLQVLHEEEATRLRNALAEKEQENSILRDTVVAQDKIIVKQNGKISFLKKVAKYAAIGGLAAGIGIGIKIGGRR